MFKKKMCITLLSALLYTGTTLSANAVGVSYFPQVTKEMSVAEYWSEDTQYLMTYEEIIQQNAATISQSGTNMYDLKNQPDTVDGVALNAALLKSSQSDAKYYAGRTYLNGQPTTEASFAEMVQNTQNTNPQTEQKVLYGIAVNRSALRTFPTEIPIGDDPKDKDFDYQYLSAVRVNEPVVITSISADKKYYLAKSICCSGWIAAEDVAICKDKQQWISAWDISPDKALVVYGDKVYTEYSNTDTQTAAHMLTMGTVLEQADITDPNSLIDNRAAYQNYTVWMPVRNTDGSYSKKCTLIAEHQKISNGYLPLTQNNIVCVAMNALGNTYGWGGSLFSDDCSGYIRNIYKCFGLELARNTTWQTAMPMAKSDMRNMCREERTAVLDALPCGSVLFFSGHEMLYLGKENGNYYVISAISSVMQPENAAVRQRIRSTVINTLDVKRANGNSWLDDLIAAIIPYQTTTENVLPSTAWYHEGVAFCLQNKLMKGDENKMFHPYQNVTWAQFLQILMNMDGSQTNTSDAQGNWYDTAVQWAVDNRILPTESVDVTKDITRESIAEVLYLYAQYKGLQTDTQGDLTAYADQASITPSACSAMVYVTQNGIMHGKTETTLNPKDYTTRAEIAVMIQRFSALTK